MTAPATPAPLPAEAVRAAQEAISRELQTTTPDGFATWLEADERLAHVALEAAAPHLAAAERDLLDQAESTLHSLSLRLLGVSPQLKVPYTDAPELSPWTRTIGPLAKRAHDLAMTIRKHLGMPHRWASSGLGTPPLEIGDVITKAVAAERERIAQLAEQLLTQWGLDARRLRSAGANEIDRAVARRLDTCAREVADLLRQDAEGGGT